MHCGLLISENKVESWESQNGNGKMEANEANEASCYSRLEDGLCWLSVQKILHRLIKVISTVSAFLCFNNCFTI